ncbi:hypothetical protein ACFLT5_01955, partial [Chloroflexota bacterium]
MHTRSVHVSILAVLLALVLVFTVFAGPEGDPEPLSLPESTFSFTLEDIYQRLDAGVAGTAATFTEPSSGPAGWTGHTLDEIMAKAPMADNAAGALPGNVLEAGTYWSLRTDGTWGTSTGAMPDNGAVTIVPSTTDQSIVGGYHNGGGYVEGDTDLVESNIWGGVNIFGVIGTHSLISVPKTGQTGCWDEAGTEV